MRTKKILSLMLVTVLMALSMSVSAAGKTTDYVSVTGYDPKIDYSAEMDKCLADGGKYALQIGMILEKQRNLKIEKLNLPFEKTNYFTTYSSAKEIQEAIANARKPKYTEAEKDLLYRVVMVEAGCNWIPDWVQRMVVSVVLNRVDSAKYPNTIRDVLWQPGQYNPYALYSKTPTPKVRANVDYVLEHGRNCPTNVLGQNGDATGNGIYAQYYDAELRSTIYFTYV